MAAGRIRLPHTLTRHSLPALRDALRDALSAEAPVIVLEGDERTFCLGADLLDLASGGDVESEARTFAALLGDLVNARKPVVAEVRGRAVGGGVGLAAAADLVLASDGADFALTEALFGAVPAIVAPILLRRMSPATVTLWTLSSETWRAADARQVGLVDVCVPAAELEGTTTTWVRRLARASTDALVPFRRCINRGVAEAAADGAAITIERFRDPAVLGRVKAFVEHGMAPWQEK